MARAKQIYVEKNTDSSDIYLRSSHGVKDKPDTITVARVQEIASMISRGASRATIGEYVKQNYNLTSQSASLYYHAALRFLQPENVAEYKNNMAMANIDRLEKIIEQNIDTHPKIAISAIAELNKVLGLTNGNTVAVQTDSSGNTKFVVTFGE